MPERIDETAWSELRATAERAAANAYAPYSRFRVGAAVLTESGGVFAGANVENASHGLAICAERSAVFQAVAHEGPSCVVRALLVYTPTDEPTTPCGACRQVLRELGPDAAVRCVCDGPATLERTAAELLPDPFGLAHPDRDGSPA